MGRKPGQPRGKYPITCIVCGKIRLVEKDKLKTAKFCNYKCMGIYKSTANRGDGNPKWKGGVCTRKDGRRIVYCPGHPRATSGSAHVLEYILIVENIIGRPLTVDEIIHHKDENVQNNEPDNLVITTLSEHQNVYHKIKKRDKQTGRLL